MWHRISAATAPVPAMSTAPSAADVPAEKAVTTSPTTVMGQLRPA
jgi:hypothetical protein